MIVVLNVMEVENLTKLNTGNDELNNHKENTVNNKHTKCDKENVDEISCSTPLKNVTKSNNNMPIKVVDYSFTDSSSLYDEHLEENHNSSSEDYFLSTPSPPKTALFTNTHKQKQTFNRDKSLNVSSSSEESYPQTPAVPSRHKLKPLTKFVPETPCQGDANYKVIKNVFTSIRTVFDETTCEEHDNGCEEIAHEGTENGANTNAESQEESSSDTIEILDAPERILEIELATEVNTNAGSQAESRSDTIETVDAPNRNIETDSATEANVNTENAFNRNTSNNGNLNGESTGTGANKQSVPTITVGDNLKGTLRTVKNAISEDFKKNVSDKTGGQWTRTSQNGDAFGDKGRAYKVTKGSHQNKNKNVWFRIRDQSANDYE